MVIDIKKELETYSIILSVLPNYYYSESIRDILKNLDDARICYVDLNKGTEAAMKNFKAGGIETKNIFFIDGVSMSINSNAKFDNAILISSPYALTEMGIAISEVMKSGSFDILIFDSLSTLNVYVKEINGISGKFTSHIVNKLRARKNKGLLTCLDNDMESDIVKQSSLFVDKVLKVDSSNLESAKTAKHKAATIITAILAIGAFTFFHSVSNNITAFAVADENVHAYSTSFGLILALVFFTIIGSLIIFRNRKQKIIQVPINIKERKNKNALRNDFKNKINKWLKEINMLGLF